MRSSAVIFTRRKILRSAAIALAAVPLIVDAKKKARPNRMPAQIGDVLAFPSWEQNGALVKASSVQAGAGPLTVFPHDQSLSVTRERYRLNQILLLRLDPQNAQQNLDELGADGFLAYSGICTHTACAVSEWDGESNHFICPCHSSEFDPVNKGKVVNGPATRSLPSLGIKVENDLLVIVSGFSAKVGAKKKAGFP
ncbi:MAG: Rieske (2Fe-2S) protein [Pseudomonadota bacterium]